MGRPQPYEIYRGIRIFLYREVGRDPNEWRASIQWQSRLIDVERKDGECSSLEQTLAAAHRLIDQLKRGRAQ